MSLISQVSVGRMIRHTSLKIILRNILVGIVLSASAYAYMHMDFHGIMNCDDSTEISKRQRSIGRLLPLVLTPSGAMGEFIILDN